jgi:hypothetical protein
MCASTRWTYCFLLSLSLPISAASQQSGKPDQPKIHVIKTGPNTV